MAVVVRPADENGRQAVTMDSGGEEMARASFKNLGVLGACPGWTRETGNP